MCLCDKFKKRNVTYEKCIKKKKKWYKRILALVSPNIYFLGDFSINSLDTKHQDRRSTRLV